MRFDRNSKWLIIILSLVLLVVGFFPLLGFAGSWVPSNPLVPACNTGIRNGTLENPCGWEQLIVLADNILKFFLYISVPIAAIAFAYAGWLYLSARGDHSQISKAHEIFLNVAIGLVFVLTAWRDSFIEFKAFKPSLIIFAPSESCCIISKICLIL